MCCSCYINSLDLFIHAIAHIANLLLKLNETSALYGPTHRYQHLGEMMTLGTNDGSVSLSFIEGVTLDGFLGHQGTFLLTSFICFLQRKPLPSLILESSLRVQSSEMLVSLWHITVLGICSYDSLLWTVRSEEACIFVSPPN